VDSTDLKLAELEMTDEELANVYGGFVLQQACEFEAPAGEDHIFM
jgi:bacteriocin-like protein